MLVEARPEGPGASGIRLSNSTTALLLASRPVTTLRMSDAMAVAQVRASAAAGHNVILSINASLDAGMRGSPGRAARRPHGRAIERKVAPFDNESRPRDEVEPWRPITSISGSPWGDLFVLE